MLPRPPGLLRADCDRKETGASRSGLLGAAGPSIRRFRGAGPTRRPGSGGARLEPAQRDKNDGLVLRDALITAALRCAPPGNKPTPEQLRHCFSYLVREIELLDDLHVVVGLGAIGTRAAETALASAGYAFAARHAFVHGAESIARSGDRAIVLLSSYHPSRQNTNTGVLTEPMLDAIFTRARAIVSAL
jgi:uracil-DNA glycosylase family 4